MQYVGNALNIIPTISDEFDLVFIDADKENYTYFEIVIDKKAIGGFIIADNVLWSGKVVEQVNEKDNETKAIKAFNTLVHVDDRVGILMPIRDGLMICQNKMKTLFRKYRDSFSKQNYQRVKKFILAF